MNREIKFRGKHLHVMSQNGHLDGRWIYGYLSAENYINSPEYVADMLIAPKTVGQYTGLKDKNGVEIYEGDILDCVDRICIVRWNINCGTWDSIFIRYTGKKLCSNGITPVEWKFRASVIGNIEDNSELLGVAEWTIKDNKC